MKIRSLNIILFFCFSILSLSCNNMQHSEGLEEGDLLFQNLNCGELCDAIEKVTEGVDGKNFSHCAMVVKINDTLKVIEAIGKEVQINSLPAFFERSGDTSEIQNITVGRLNDQFLNMIPKAALISKQRIGEPYDDEFIMNNGKWYCSELIYEVFREANNKNVFFNLEPMTFKDPETGAFIPAWENYYKALGREIPEGQMGINPGLISRSNKIQIIKIKSIK